MGMFFTGVVVGVVGTIAVMVVAIMWPDGPQRPLDPED
jgi:hypothetical protein